VRALAAVASALALTLAGCGGSDPSDAVPDAGELESIRSGLLDSFMEDRFGAALTDVNERAGADATALKVEVIPTRISFDVVAKDGAGTTYVYDGQGSYQGEEVLRTPDERKAFALSLVRADAPERVFAEIKRVTGLEDLKFGSAYFEVSVFELERGPVWLEGGGNSAGQSVSYEATPEGKLIEQVGGTFRP
jgi:hypothetical protein